MLYRLSNDLRHVSLDAPELLAGRQLLYLFGQNGTRIFYLYRYPDTSWQLVTTNTASGSGSSNGLQAEQELSLVALVAEYASLGAGTERVVTPDGWELRLYGLGTKVALDGDDRDRLLRLGSELGAQVLP